ncbi:MAG: TonB-dependent receptor [Burkholderiaceae bacterium]|nr:MAG: TonB-dependent receptor [Burkholderiaceae bacterium]
MCCVLSAGLSAQAQDQKTEPPQSQQSGKKTSLPKMIESHVDKTSSSIEEQKSVVIQAQKSRSAFKLGERALQSQLSGMNPLKSLHQLPGVNFQSADPWGNNEQNFSLFIHGFNAQQLGYTLDGVPLGDQQYGNYNGLSPQRAVISENLRSVLLNAGAGDLATASTSNLGGTIEFSSNDPASETRWSYAQTLGSYAASRSYLRYDSGELDDASQSFYLSAVRLRARAWDFDAVQGGEHFNAKWVKYFSRAKLSAYYSYSDKIEPNEDSTVNGGRETFMPYTRPFTYPNFSLALAYLSPQGQPPVADGANYRNYFGVAQRRDHLAYFKLEQQLDQSSHFDNQLYVHLDDGLGSVAGPIGVAGLPNLFQVYFPQQDLKQTFGGTGYAVRTTEYQIRRAGWMASMRQSVGEHQWLAGLWLEYNRSSAYRRWYALDLHNPLTPYQVPSDPKITQYGSEIDNKVLQISLQDEWRPRSDLQLQFGVKSSLQFADGRFPIQPKLGAILGGSSALPEGSIVTKQWLLPQFGVVWQLDRNPKNEHELYLNLQKNLRQFVTYGAVGLSPWSLSNQAAFDLFKRSASPETAKTLELGWRSKQAPSEQINALSGVTAIETQLTAYLVQFNDRLLQISPTPVISSIVNGNPILANVGSVKTQGVDLVIQLRWGPRWSLSNALSYNSSRYQDDYFNGTTRVATKDKEVPASPQWMNKLSFAYRSEKLDWYLNSDFVGRRFATFTNDLSVASYHLLSTGLRYKLSSDVFQHTPYLHINLSNLTNRRGVSTLQVGAASGTFNSFPIPPRQWFVGLSGAF